MIIVCGTSVSVIKCHKKHWRHIACSIMYGWSHHTLASLEPRRYTKTFLCYEGVFHCAWDYWCLQAALYTTACHATAHQSFKYDCMQPTILKFCRWFVCLSIYYIHYEIIKLRRLSSITTACTFPTVLPWFLTVMLQFQVLNFMSQTSKKEVV